MMGEHEVKGIFVPVVTPFLPDGRLDLDSYRSCLAKLLKFDLQGIVLNGTTGEAPTVSWEEVELLADTTRALLSACPTRIPLIIGTGTNDTASTVKRTERAGHLGADAVLIVTPYYNRPSQEGVLEHVRRAAEVGVPIIAYEIPSRTGLRLTLDTIRRMMALEGVIGLKDSSGGTELVSRLTSGDTKPVLCGEDLFFHAMLSQGAAGGMLASANVQTESFIEVYRLARDRAWHEAKLAFDRLVPLLERLFAESNPAPLKWLLAQQGKLASDTVRLPMTSITDELKIALEPFI